MRKYFYVLLLLLLLAIAGMGQLRSSRMPFDSGKNDARPEKALTTIRTEMPGVILNYCVDEGLGIKFLCDFGWRQSVSGNGAIFFINDHPDVRLKIIRIDIDIRFIQQLSRERLEVIGQYAPEFVIEDAEVSGLKATKVKAFSKKAPETRLLDYYFVRNNKLYAIMFSVNPKEKWDGYKFLFEGIVKYLEFL